MSTEAKSKTGGRNPFADCGGIVRGVRFLGRASELRTIRTRVLGRNGFGSLGIVGMPRVGKSSLAMEAFLGDSTALREMRATVTRTDVGLYDSVAELFRALVREQAAELDRYGLLDDHTAGLAESVRAGQGDLEFAALANFFRSVKDSGARAICILDEFDAGRFIFSDDRKCFHWVRELASNPDFKTPLVIISKRNLSDISRLAGHDSDYWYNVILLLRLKQYDAKEAVEFIRCLEESGVPLSDEAHDEMLSFCGRHPFLLDLFAFFAWEAAAKGQVLSRAVIQSSLRGDVLGFFRQLETILKDSSLLRRLLQVICGPLYDVRRTDIEELVDYGLLERTARGELRIFCRSFGEYLFFIEREVDIWPLWREVERELRAALAGRLQAVLGVDWMGVASRRWPSVGAILANCRIKMDREEAKFGLAKGQGVLAYSYPHEIYQIMCADWGMIGSGILGGTKADWRVKMDLLAKVRTPLAHSRDEVLSEAERSLAEGYCKEIKEALQIERS